MNIHILELIEGARKARGLTVIIDVFRAFSVECYQTAQGAEEIYPIGSLEEAFRKKEEDPEGCVLFGERGGAKVDGCDYGNSPHQFDGVDFTGKTILHTTSAGTQGIVNAEGAEQIITGSLVNAKAVAAYIRQQDPEEVSLVAMGVAGKETAEEDLLCARYIESLLKDDILDMEDEIRRLRESGGKKFFNPDTQEIFPREDFALCTSLDRFPFVLKVEKEGNVPIIRPLQRFVCLGHRIYSKDEFGRILAEITFPEEAPGQYVIDNVYIAPQLMSRNLADELMREATAFIRRKGGKVKDGCSFASWWRKENEL